MDPSFELIAAALAALRADATVAALVGNRVYDRVPQKLDGGIDVTSPYISVGPTTSVPDDFDCIEGEEITFQIDIWSWGKGEAYSSAECRKLSGAVKRALHNAELSLPTNALASLSHELTRILPDPAGGIHHGAVQFTASVETH